MNIKSIMAVNQPFQNYQPQTRRYCFTRSKAVLARVFSWPICIFLILMIFTHTAQTRRLLPCELAGEMYILDVPKEELPLWLCIAEYESRFNTHVIGSRNLDGSLDYGIFQISDKYWCQPHYIEEDNDVPIYRHTYNECFVNCTNLVADDITAAVKCAKQIRKQQGWSAWTVYEEFCNDTLPDIEHCFT